MSTNMTNPPPAPITMITYNGKSSFDLRSVGGIVVGSVG